MSKYQILLFSATGNTKYLANILKEKLNCQIDNRKTPCEHLIIMSSIHAFRIPNNLIENIGNVNKISLIMVGCNNSFVNQTAGLKVLKYAKKNNIEIGVYKVIAMPLTIVKKFDIKYGRKIIKQASNEIDKISKSILNNKNDKVKIPFKSKIFYHIHGIENFMVRLFGLELKANNNCISCGLCQKTCPRNNIKVNKKPKFSLKCMMCMSCIYNCPKKAIHPRLSKFIEFKDGYNINQYLKK